MANTRYYPPTHRHACPTECPAVPCPACPHCDAGTTAHAHLIPQQVLCPICGVTCQGVDNPLEQHELTEHLTRGNQP